MTKFTDYFEHFSVKHRKRKPNLYAFIAAIVGYGCNIGIGKISRISQGILGSAIETVSNWYISYDGLIAANNCIMSFMQKMNITHIYKRSDDVLHTVSDGLKCGISVEGVPIGG